MELLPDDLRLFVTESNRIEGIHRKPTMAELRAHCVFLALEVPTIADLQAFVQVVAPGKPLRQQEGQNVRVGDHVAPPGGPNVPLALGLILDLIATSDPHSIHLAYETLHPFMDGNGRSGRALWLWQMLNQREAYHALRMGFLHLFYYQTLSAIGRPRPTSADTSEAAPVVQPIRDDQNPSSNRDKAR